MAVMTIDGGNYDVRDATDDDDWEEWNSKGNGKGRGGGWKLGCMLNMRRQSRTNVPQDMAAQLRN